MVQQLFFDADRLAATLNTPKETYEALKRSVREEFPDVEMMYHLHLLRALHTLSKKYPPTTKA